MAAKDYYQILEVSRNSRGGVIGESEPCYPISVVARMLSVHAQTLRYYEKAGLIEPSRSRGNTRLYSMKDLDRLRQIKTLMDDLGVNLAGAEVVLRMVQHITEMKQRMRELELEIKRLTEDDSIRGGIS